MDKKKLVLFMILNGSLYNNNYLDENLIFDDNLNDCLFYMYLYMMANDLNESKRIYTKFQERYNKLDKKQKELVKKDFFNIIDTQEENNKIKRKGEMRYE